MIVIRVKLNAAQVMDCFNGTMFAQGKIQMEVGMNQVAVADLRTLSRFVQAENLIIQQ
jgi:hypothetical protein